MISRRDIRSGLLVRTLRKVGRTPAGRIGEVDLIREEQPGMPWAFSLRWFGGSRDRYSLYFTEGDLAHFEPASVSELAAATAPPRPPRPLQLQLPYTEWLLIRGGTAVDSFETW